MTVSTGTFTVADWVEKDALHLAGEGAKVSHASIVQEFAGDLRATGAAEMLMHYANPDRATFVGFQRFEGSFDGREGTFLADLEGDYDGTTATTRLTVVPGSGTGALVGLRGQGTAVAGHEPPGRYELDLTTD